jgi:hypothetical protein
VDKIDIPREAVAAPIMSNGVQRRGRPSEFHLLDVNKGCDPRKAVHHSDVFDLTENGSFRVHAPLHPGILNNVASVFIIQSAHPPTCGTATSDSVGANQCLLDDVLERFFGPDVQLPIAVEDGRIESQMMIVPCYEACQHVTKTKRFAVIVKRLGDDNAGAIP